MAYEIPKLTELSRKMIDAYNKAHGTSIKYIRIKETKNKGLYGCYKRRFAFRKGGVIYEESICINMQATQFDHDKRVDTLIHELAHYFEEKHPDNQRVRGVMHSPLFYKIYDNIKTICKGMPEVAPCLGKYTATTAENRQLRKGQKVWFNYEGTVYEGRVVRRNKSRATIKTSTYSRWRISYSAILTSDPRKAAPTPQPEPTKPEPETPKPAEPETPKVAPATATPKGCVKVAVDGQGTLPYNYKVNKITRERKFAGDWVDDVVVDGHRGKRKSGQTDIVYYNDNGTWFKARKQ